MPSGDPRGPAPRRNTARGSVCTEEQRPQALLQLNTAWSPSPTSAQPPIVPPCPAPAQSAQPGESEQCPETAGHSLRQRAGECDLPQQADAYGQSWGTLARQVGSGSSHAPKHRKESEERARVGTYGSSWLRSLLEIQTLSISCKRTDKKVSGAKEPSPTL